MIELKAEELRSVEVTPAERVVVEANAAPHRFLQRMASRYGQGGSFITESGLERMDPRREAAALIENEWSLKRRTRRKEKAKLAYIIPPGETVKAVQFTVANFKSGLIDRIPCFLTKGSRGMKLALPKSSGAKEASEGWWILYGKDGTHCPVAPDVYEAQYKPVLEERRRG